MKILFSYDIDKDVENFILSAKSLNNREPTILQKAYARKCGKLVLPDKVRRFILEHIAENKIDMVSEIAKVSKRWSQIEDKFTKRARTIFKVQNPARKIVVYLTTNSRCTYNMKKNYFFVYIKSKNTNLTIMHELFHFYTWKALSNKVNILKISPTEYNDIKESLTELLNLEFHDLLNGAVDKGYPQHRKIRMFIKESWQRNPNLEGLIKDLQNFSRT